MNKKKQKNRRLPGAGLRLLSLLPVFNWISLIYIGIKCSSSINVICGVLYGVLTFTVPSLAAYLWLIGIVQYAIVHGIAKKEIGTQYISGSRNAAPREKDQPFSDRHSKDMERAKQPAKERIQAAPKVNTASAAIGYTDMVLPGSQEKTQTIPLKSAVSGTSRDTSVQSKTTEAKPPAVSGTRDTFDFDFEESYSGRSSDSKLMKEMKEFADRKGAEVPFVPFFQYWPTYDSMNRQQKAWYFYWRTEVRNKNYPDTDLSYIFVHVYELLSGCGWQDPQNGLDQLMALWMAYRERFPKLDAYLSDWTFDFAQLHELTYSAPDIADIPLPRQPAVRDLLIDQHSGDRPLKLSFAMIDALCDYSLVNSKFYKDGHQLLMQEAIPRIVALADAALIKKKNRGILAVYGPKRTRKQSYFAFQSAVCPDANKRIDISVKAYTSSQNLRGYINELVRYGENALRSLYGCRGRLRGVALDEETANLVDAFLKKEYSPNRKAANTPAQKVEVKLDFESIDALRVQSDAVRDALDVPEEAETKKEALTDLQEVTALLAGLSPAARVLLDMLHDHGWECVLNPDTTDSINEINKLASQYLACALLVQEHEYLIVEDDYRDELDYIYSNRPETAEPKEPVSEEEDRCFDRSVLSDPMKQLLDMLTPVQIETLWIILSQGDSLSRLEQIAEDAMTMPEILIDEINDVATQFLDDILIDAQGDVLCILEQYEPELKKALK
ncbi:MAG: TerB N-terminal domain-containing protein [Faecousia sp.]